MTAAEAKLPNGSWAASPTERIPEILGDEIKGHYARFFAATKKLTPDELKDVIPMASPKTHHFEGRKLIAKNPVGQWEAAGARYPSARGRCLPATRVAKQDYSNHEKVFETEKKALAKPPPRWHPGRDELASAASGSTEPEPAAPA